MKRGYLFPLLGGAMLIIAGLSAPAAQARYIVTLTQRGSDVVATGNGSLDLTALTFLFTNSPPPPGGKRAALMHRSGSWSSGRQARRLSPSTEG
jgi:hypothetical protein